MSLLVEWPYFIYLIPVVKQGIVEHGLLNEVPEAPHRLFKLSDESGLHEVIIGSHGLNSEFVETVVVSVHIPL